MNRCIRVLQTHALPLGYCAMIKKYSIDLSKFWHITEWGSSGVADPRLTTWLLRLTYEAPCGCIEPHLCDVEIFYSDIF